MNRTLDLPVNRWLIGSGLCLLTAPILWWAIAFAQQLRFAHALEKETLSSYHLIVWLLVLLALAILCVRRLRGFPIFVILLGAAIIAQEYLGNLSSEKSYQVQMGGNSWVDGIDVYCNDVHLGKTPFRLTAEEFALRIEPRKTPPEQPHVEVRHPDDKHFDFDSAKWTWVPQDIFKYQNEWPPNHGRYSRSDFEGLMQDFRETDFWWRFERNGCQGIAAAMNFFGRGVGSRGSITIDVSPSIEIRSAALHAQALVDWVTEADFQIEEDVIRHILVYREQLFPEFLKHIEFEPRLEIIFQRAAEVDFKMPLVFTESEGQQILDRVLSQIRERELFSIPSTASTAVLHIARLYPDLIVDRFEKLLDSRRAWTHRSGSGDRISWSGTGVPIERVALEYAIRELRLQPDQLFDRLVYLSHSNPGFLVLVGQYERKEAVDLIRHYLVHAEQRHQKFQAAQFCFSLRNPMLEAEVRSFIEKNAGTSHFSMQNKKFVLDRLDGSQEELQSLASWVAGLRRSDTWGRNCRTEMLVRIPASNVREHLERMNSGNRSERSVAPRVLRDHPNPALDEFLIDKFQVGLEKNDGGSMFNEVVQALSQSDSATIRAFVESRLAEGGKPWMRLVEHIDEAPKWAWLVPALAKLSDADKAMQESAVELLERIGTDAAWDALEAWPPKSPVEGVVKHQIAKRKIALQENAQRIEQARRLIAGKMKPDDLLPASIPFTWTKSGYQLVNDEAAK